MIRLGFVANPFSLPLTLALERGYFVAIGLEVEVERFANGSAASAALADGTIEVGVSGHLQTLLVGSGDARQVFLAPLGFEASPDHLPITLIGRDGIAGARDLDQRGDGTRDQITRFEKTPFARFVLRGAQFAQKRRRFRFAVLERGEPCAISASG